MSNLVRFGGGAIANAVDVTPTEGPEVDISGYLGGVLLLDTQVVSRTGGITFGSVTKTLQGYNPSTSAWVTLCNSAVGGSGSDVWLTDQDRVIVTNNIYTKLRETGSSANNAGSARFANAFAVK